MPSNRLPLTIALAPHDHAYAVTSGEVEIAGVAPTFLELTAAEPLGRLLGAPDRDVAEVSAAQYVMQRAAGDDRVVALPVFTSRAFAHRCVYVRRDRVRKPEDLRGARVGTTDWAATECVYARGMLAEMYGIAATELRWVQAGMDRPGVARADRAPHLPEGLELVAEPERTLQEMLWAGELDAVIAPAYPPGFRSAAAAGDLVGRLFEAPGEDEREYYATTSVFPITHLIGVRRELLARHRWLASNLYRSFEVARRRYFSRLEDIAASRMPIPWVAGHLESLRRTFGAELWPYGVEPNRSSLQGLLRYCAEQGLIAGTGLGVDDLFAHVEPFVDGM